MALRALESLGTAGLSVGTREAVRGVIVASYYQRTWRAREFG